MILRATGDHHVTASGEFGTEMAKMARSRGTRSVRGGVGGDPARAAFAHRVRAIMEDRGLSVTETARRVRQYLPEGESISQASISHYRTGRAVPRLRYLDALSLALGVTKSELMDLDRDGKAAMPGSRSATAPRRASPIEPGQNGSPQCTAATPDGSVHFVDLGDRMRLRVDHVVPWSTGLQILQILRGSNAVPESES
jgi:transcriptional regulator with XRE-family HTH domain